MRMGLEQAGWRVIYANDIDEKKREMYDAHFKDEIPHFHLGDIHKIDPADIPVVDLATASFPCNDLSLAGAMEGLEGSQSSAFWGFIRILKLLKERRPPFVMLENVLGFLTSNNGEDFYSAMRALNRLGYSTDPIIIDAALFVPQSRKRLFVLGKLGDKGEPYVEVSDLRPAALVDFIKENPDIKWGIRDLPSPPRSNQKLMEILDDPPETSHEWWSRERAGYFLGQLSEKHRRIADAMIAGKRFSYATAFRRIRNGRSMAEIRTDGIAGCLRTPRGGSGRQILFKAGREKYFVRLLNPRECARLMGAPGYRIGGRTLNQALFGFGDAVCVPVVNWIAENYLNKVVCSRLTNVAA